MINSAKPNIKLDKALQDIVYKLVPGLFQKEMERRQQFYASRPGPAASATPEQRGEDTERIIFSPEDVISFSLEYSDATDTDSISSKSSDSNEPQPATASTRRYLQCPAVVNINHLKKFLSMKFDIDSSQFAIDILYKRVPLPDYYTLMDIAYIYNWKRNEPMRFFYQIIDYVAIRNRIFDINRKGTQFPDRKPSPTCTEDTNVSSPIPHINDNGSEASSGTDSPMPDDNLKKLSDTIKKETQKVKDGKNYDSKQSAINCCPSPFKKNDDEVEKSQFLNSFELTAKHNSQTPKTSPKSTNDNVTLPKEAAKNVSTAVSKTEETLKRKIEPTKAIPEMKKIKIEVDKTKSTTTDNNVIAKVSSTNNMQKTVNEASEKSKCVPDTSKVASTENSNHSSPVPALTKDIKPPPVSSFKQQIDGSVQKRNVSAAQTLTSPKRKTSETTTVAQPSPLVQKTVSPLKLQIPKPEAVSTLPKHVDTPKPVSKKMPDLKPSMPVNASSQNKVHPVGRLRMDLLANNCDPIMDRSKILSQVKTTLPVPNMQPTSGDPLKSLFDSCKINIPSSLSITLTDQKLDPRSPDPTHTDPKKNIVNKNLTSGGSTSHKVPSPPVHNYIEILKLPDNDSKKPNKPENLLDKSNSQTKVENSPMPSKPAVKSSESSAKGPIPNLKPIADTKLAKAQASNLSAPITFQQTFEQQLQSLQSDKKSKLPKTKTQVPKLVPATPKSFSAANKLNTSNKSNPISNPILENKTGTALDLSTPHNIQSQLGPQQTKAFETMKSIDNLAKKQSMPSKLTPISMSQANLFSSLTSRALTTAPPLRVPSANTINQLKLDKMNANASQANTSRKEQIQKSNQIKHPSNSNTSIQSPNFNLNSPNATLPSPRSQTRSPSSSPKLVIAEDKQGNSSASEHNVNQSNQITSTQITSSGSTKTESPKPSPGPSKVGIKAVKPLMPASKITGIRQPITPTLNSSYAMNSAADYLAQSQFNLHTQQAILNNIAWMATLQPIIPFKSRKRTYYNENKGKINNENENFLNIEAKVDLNNSEEETCSPKKISKRKDNAKSILEETITTNNKLEETKYTLKPLVSREKEIEWLTNFLIEHLDKEQSASLYISGQPGTGKTASLTYILQIPKIREGYKQVYINCTMMKSAASIYSRICKELHVPTTGTSEKACFNALEKYLFKKHKMIVLVLDEIDQLDSKRQCVLYTLFEWGALPSRMVLVGVANALDLTQRALPRLQASLRPTTMHFPPYTKEQIINIFTSTLADDMKNMFSPVALQMLAAKIAAVSGDMRRALDIGRRVIDLARRSKFSENRSIDDMMKDSSVTVELKQVLEVLNDVYGSSRKIDNDVDEGLPMQQKLILCSLMLMLSKGRNKEIIMGKLHEVYKRVAESRNIAPLELSEMCSAVSLLEALGAVTVGGGGAGRTAGRGRRVRLRWHEDELAAALKDRPLLSTILADTSCLTSH
ncbi:putative Cdc6 [Danaus plexippus plexippus]|uniref:Cdc6 n=1 Tax=Danaus plexippus plexippus TaxID=278856 RepID=A0A212F0P9_DANPL|nr:putative Cdc6 [Danaus plexippus plexippus]